MMLKEMGLGQQRIFGPFRAERGLQNGVDSEQRKGRHSRSSPSRSYPCRWNPKGGERLGTILLVIGPFPTRIDVRAVPDLPNHPKPLGPYSHVVVANGFVFISAQAPIVPGAKSGEWAAAEVAGQTRQSLTNIAA